jgi:hypothetical protein
MRLDDLDTTGVRRSDLFAATLRSIGVEPDQAVFVIAAKETKRWDFWIATEIGLATAYHAEGDADQQSLSRVVVSEVSAWDDLKSLRVATETWRERGIAPRTRITFTIDDRELKSEAFESTPDEIGLFAFAQACLRRRAGLALIAPQNAGA